MDIENVKEAAKVPLSAKVSPKVRDCLDILMKPIDDKDQRKTADECLEDFLDKTADSNFSSEKMKNYLEKKLIHPLIEEKLNPELEKIIINAENLNEDNLEAEINELLEEVEINKNNSIDKAKKMIEKLFKLGGQETYDFVLNNIIIDELGKYNVFKIIEFKTKETKIKINSKKKSNSLNTLKSKTDEFYSKLDKNDIDIIKISTFYFKNSEKDFNRLVDYIVYLNAQFNSQKIDIFDKTMLNNFKVSAASFNEKILRGIAILVQNTDLDVFQNTRKLLTSWPIPENLRKRFDNEVCNDITIEKFILNNFEVNSFSEFYILFGAFNKYYLELYGFLADFIKYSKEDN